MPQNLHHDQKTCHLFIATAVAAISRRVLTALLLTALKSSAAEVSEGTLSGELGWADLGSKLESLAVR